MKGLFSLIIATMLVGQVWAAKNYDFKSEDLYYKIVDQSTIQLVGSDTYKKFVSVIIPETVTYKKKNYTVVGIANSAFSYCEKLEYVSIPESVTSIGGKAFEKCENLKKAEFASIESLCQIQFAETKDSNPLFNAHYLYINGKEITNLIIPNGVTSIGAAALCGCRSITSVTIPESVTSIGNSAFGGCANLMSVTIPNSITNIGAYAFSECTELVSITIPNTVSEICDGTFRKCSKLESVSIPNSILKIGYSAFYGCENLTDAVIPNSVKEIGVSAFGRCKIQTLDIPSSVEKIGDNAFISCLNLIQVKIPTSVKIIGKDAFSNCPNLKNVYCQAKVRPEGWDTYWIADKHLSKSFSRNEIIKWGEGNKSATTNKKKDLLQEMMGDTQPERYYDFAVVCSSGQTLYYKHTFNPSTVRICLPMWYPNTVGEFKTYGDCEKPKGNLIIPETVTNGGKTYIVTEIGDGVFNNCKELTSVTIPNSISKIGENAFWGCDNLTSATIKSEGRFDGTGLFFINGGVRYQVLSKNEVMVDTKEDENPFKRDSEKYSGDIVIPAKVLAGNTFSVIAINYAAFAECIELKSVAIPNTIKTIGQDAFRNCIHLTAIYCQAKSEPFGWNPNWNPNKYKVVWGAIDKFK